MKGHVFDLGHTVASFLFLSHALFSKFPTVQVGWTLENEMFFYLLFAIGINLKRETARYGLIFLALSVFSFFQPVVFEFLFGMTIGLAFVYLPKSSKDRFRRYSPHILVLGVLLLLGSIHSVQPNTNRLILWGGPSFFIVFACVFGSIFHLVYIFNVIIFLFNMLSKVIKPFIPFVYFIQ